VERRKQEADRDPDGLVHAIVLVDALGAIVETRHSSWERRSKPRGMKEGSMTPDPGLGSAPCYPR
jgi:hypothetical protein